MNFKNITKKWGKIALMGAVLTGSVGGMLSLNENRASAMYVTNKGVVNGSYNVPISIYVEDGYMWEDWGSPDIYYGDDQKTPAGNYSVQFVPDAAFVSTGVKLSVQYWYNSNSDSISLYNNTITSTNAISLSFTVSENMINGYISFKVYGDQYDTNIVSKMPDKLYLNDFTFTVSDTQSPVFNGYEGVYYTSYDSPKSLSQILTGIKAVDETDGEISYSIIEDNYTGKENNLGSHIVKLSASDKAGNTTQISIDIRVVDGTKPTISGKSSYTSNMSSPITESTIRSGLTASDNYDNNLSIQLVSDNFTANSKKAGSYKLTYKATDSSGNVSDIFTVTVTNKDDIKPTIEGTSTYTVSSVGTITSEHIISQLTAKDNIDSNLTIKLVEDNYTSNKSIVGNHTMTFNVTDNSGNVSNTFTVTITVEDNLPPVFWVSDDFFSVDEALTLTHEQIVAVLLAQNNIDTTQVVAYKVIEDNYTANANTPGVYAMSYQLQMSDGKVIELSSEINVIGETTSGSESETPDSTESEEKGFWEKVGDWFVDLWNKICGWFKKLFKKD